MKQVCIYNQSYMEGLSVKVKFKGIKLPLEFSGQSEASVSQEFMTKKTIQNIRLVKILVNKSEDKLSKDVIEKAKIKKKVGRPRKLKRTNVCPNLSFQKNKSESEEKFKLNGYKSLSPKEPPFLSKSVYFNKKTKNTNIESIDLDIDPLDMQINSDFDFILWIKCMNYFKNVSSLKSELHYLNFQDIGVVSLANKWYTHPHTCNTSYSSKKTEIELYIESLRKELIQNNLKLNDVIKNLRDKLRANNDLTKLSGKG